MPRGTLIRLRRGLAADVASIADAQDGELFLASDTNELYIGEGDGSADPIVVDQANILNPTAAYTAPVRGTVAGATASLADDATGDLSLAIGKIATALKIQTSAAAWVRLYSTAAYRTADAGRLITEDPEGEHGLIGEVLTDAGNLTLDLDPPFLGANLDGSPASTWYLAVQNKSGGTVAITVTVTRLVMEV
jgi:hypothetical protein